MKYDPNSNMNGRALDENNMMLSVVHPYVVIKNIYQDPIMSKEVEYTETEAFIREKSIGRIFENQVHYYMGTFVHNLLTDLIMNEDFNDEDYPIMKAKVLDQIYNDFMLIYDINFYYDGSITHNTSIDIALGITTSAFNILDYIGHNNNIFITDIEPFRIFNLGVNECLNMLVSQAHEVYLPAVLSVSNFNPRLENTNHQCNCGGNCCCHNHNFDL